MQNGTVHEKEHDALYRSKNFQSSEMWEFTMGWAGNLDRKSRNAYKICVSTSISLEVERKKGTEEKRSEQKQEKGTKK
jgi:hypothetical protein